MQKSTIKAYGDTKNDGKVQLSFTLPVAATVQGAEIAKKFLREMGFDNPQVVYYKELTAGFTFFNCYGSSPVELDISKIKLSALESNVMSLEETDLYIKEQIGRPLVVVGASTGSDAHTVGIDAIMNMKGFAGHWGLERYQMFKSYNLGSQVENEEFIARALEYNADILLVSQTVTQKEIHIKNLVNLIELLEAEGIREKVIVICGGARITDEIAKELGYDAGFGMNSFADDVASYAVQEFVRRKNLR